MFESDRGRPRRGPGARRTHDRCRLLVWRAAHSGILRVRFHATPVRQRGSETESEVRVVALIALLLILAIFGGLGFAVHALWIILVVALILWLIGFFLGGVDGGRRRWYGRW